MSDTEARTKTRLKRPSMWTVVFLNDDYTPMSFVVQVLMTVFNQTPSAAQQIMMTVHTRGVAKVGHYTREIADQKVYETMRLAAVEQHPLHVVTERV